MKIIKQKISHLQNNDHFCNFSNFLNHIHMNCVTYFKIHIA